MVKSLCKRSAQLPETLLAFPYNYQLANFMPMYFKSAETKTVIRNPAERVDAESENIVLSRHNVAQ